MFALHLTIKDNIFFHRSPEAFKRANIFVFS